MKPKKRNPKDAAWEWWSLGTLWDAPYQHVVAPRSGFRTKFSEEEEVLLLYAAEFLKVHGHLRRKDIEALAKEHGLLSLVGSGVKQSGRRTYIVRKLVQRGIAVKHGTKAKSVFYTPGPALLAEPEPPLPPLPPPSLATPTPALTPEPPTLPLPPPKTGLVHQGTEWEVVAAQAGNRYPALDFLEDSGKGKRGRVNTAHITQLLLQLADTPQGYVKSKSLKCFAVDDFTLCEIKKDQGRLFFTKHLHSRTKKKQLVLLQGFAKKQNQTSENELERAARLRSAYIAENPYGWLAWITEINDWLEW